MILLIGLVLSTIGGWKLYDYYVISAPSGFSSPYQIEVVWSNTTGLHQANETEPIEVSMLNETAIYFEFHFAVQENSTFATVIALPYRVVGHNGSYRSETGEWYVNSIGESGTIVYSVSRVPPNPSVGHIVDNVIILALNQSLLYDDRGEKTTTLSFGAYIPSGLEEELSRTGLNYGLTDDTNFTISFVIPEKARGLESFPSYNQIVPYNVDHRIQVIWNIRGFSTVRLSYNMGSEVQSYQTELAWGSFSVGLGVPTVLAVVLGWSGKLDLEEKIRAVLREGDEFANRSTRKVRGLRGERKRTGV